MLKKLTYVCGPWTSRRPKAKKLREVSCFMSISLLILWFACNWVSSCVATLGCCDTNTWNWATHSLWCLLLVCSLNVGIAFFQFWKPWMVKAGSIFLLIPRPLLVQQQHCAVKFPARFTQCQPVKIFEPLILNWSCPLWRPSPLYLFSFHQHSRVVWLIRFCEIPAALTCTVALGSLAWSWRRAARHGLAGRRSPWWLITDGDGHSGSVVEATVEAGVVCSFCFVCLLVKKSDVDFCLFISQVMQPAPLARDAHTWRFDKKCTW